MVNKMKNEKCCLNHCGATIGECKNPNCECLVCLGQKQNDCEILKNEHKFRIQQFICSNCKNHDM